MGAEVHYRFTARVPILNQMYSAYLIYRGADKSLARPTSRRILFDGENISFDASLVLIFLRDLG
jgi:hypothetical protein